MAYEGAEEAVGVGSSDPVAEEFQRRARLMWPKLVEQQRVIYAQISESHSSQPPVNADHSANHQLKILVEGLCADTIADADLSKVDLWLYWPLIYNALQKNTSLRSLTLRCPPTSTFCPFPGGTTLCPHDDGSFTAESDLAGLLACIPRSVEVAVTACDPMTVLRGLQANVVTAVDLPSFLMPVEYAKALEDALQKNTSVRTLRANWTPAVERIVKVVQTHRDAVNVAVRATDYESVLAGLKSNTISEISMQIHPFRDEVPAIVKALQENVSLQTINLATPEGRLSMTRERTTAIAAAIRGNHKLKVINFANNDVGDEGAKITATILAYGSLERLILSKCAIGAGAASIGEALVSSKLVVLDLSKNRIDDSSLLPIAAAFEHDIPLRTLDLSFNAITNCGARHLSSALRVRNTTLHKLNLCGNPIAAEVGVTILEDIERNSSLNIQMPPVVHSIVALQRGTAVTIDLRREFAPLPAAVSEHGAAALANAILFNGTLRAIDLFQNELGDRGAAWLAIALNFSKLEALDLSQNRVCEYGAAALGEALRNNHFLRVLQLEYNFIGRIGTSALAMALRENTVLQKLSLRGNPLGSYVGSLLFTFGLSHNTTVRELDLSETQIGLPCPCFEPKVAEVLSTADLFAALRDNSSLRVLRLEGNQLGDHGAISLGQALRQHCSIREVYLHTNHIGDAGAEALGDAIAHNTVLQVLHLGLRNGVSNVPSGFGNFVGDRGASAFARMLQSNTALIELDLCHNRIGDPGIEALGEALDRNAALRTLRIQSNSFGSAGVTGFFRAMGSNKSLKELSMGVGGNRMPMRTLGVEFLNTRNVEILDVHFTELVWPPPSVSRAGRGALYQFLLAAAASSHPLVPSRIMLLGHGGVGKTTLKTALLLRPPGHGADGAIAKLRESILHRIRAKWKEADVRSWVDHDLVGKPFFDEYCPKAAGITGDRLLEYSSNDVIEIFGASGTEHAKRVVDKILRVMCFLFPTRAAETVGQGRVPEGWGWIRTVIRNTLDRVYGCCVDSSRSEKRPYAVLLDIPHVWTEGIDLERWDEAGFTVWDLPGQMEVYPAHRLFSASATAVHVLLVNAAAGLVRSIAQMVTWLGQLRTVLGVHRRPQEVEVRIVATHTDDMTNEEREVLLRDLLQRAKLTFRGAFNFGSRCFATLYNADNNGVDALRDELMQLKAAGIPDFAMPTNYQRVCDDIVEESARRSRWPLLRASELNTYGHDVDGVLMVMEDLGFVRRVLGDQLILEPVTWLSRMMTAFLHPYHGVCSLVAHPDDTHDRNHEDHIEAVTISSDAACRIVNFRERLIDDENKIAVLRLLAHFDMCFELEPDRFVFPALLPCVTRAPDWLAISGAVAARRFTCERREDAVPPALSSLLLKMIWGRTDGRSHAVFMGRSTAVLSNCAADDARRCFFGFHQADDDKAVDIFALGPQRQAYLGLLMLLLSKLAKTNFPAFRLEKRSLVPAVGTRCADPCLSQVNHWLLGECVLKPKTVARGEPLTEDVSSRVRFWLDDLPASARKSVIEVHRDANSLCRDCHDAANGPFSWASLIEDVLFEPEAEFVAPSPTSPRPDSLDEIRGMQAIHALNYAVDAASHFVEDVFRVVHENILARCAHVTIDGLGLGPLPLVYKPAAAKCQQAGHAPCAKCTNRPTHVLDPIAEEVRKLHLQPTKIQWQNSDAAGWVSEDGHVELAKLFCPNLGGSEAAAVKTKFDQLDGTALFNMMSWCTRFPKDFIGRDGLGQAAARARNRLCHGNHLTKIDAETHTLVFASLRDVLKRIEQEAWSRGSSVATEALHKLTAHEDFLEKWCILERQRKVAAAALPDSQ